MNTAPTKEKVVVAMSGGVDSSVAAALLVREGYEVIGVTMKLLKKGATGFGCCGNPEDTHIAKRSAEKAGVPHYVLDYSPEFEKSIITPFVDAYVAGETPNPCLACNRYIKFDKLKDFADSIGARYLATGHYARIIRDEVNGLPRHRLFEAVDSTKDQSYVLYNTSRASLASTLYPVGSMPKTEIREKAVEFVLPNSNKKDSQEICFVPNRNYGAFVKRNLVERGIGSVKTTEPGIIKDMSGKVLGAHTGVAFYTIGQRKGLGITTPVPYYVTKIDADTNTLVVGPDQEGGVKGLQANDVNWIQGSPPAKEFKALLKIRYKHDPVPATFKATETTFEAVFDAPEKAVTPGQAAVIYLWDDIVGAREVLGGGKIVRAL